MHPTQKVYAFPKNSGRILLLVKLGAPPVSISHIGTISLSSPSSGNITPIQMVYPSFSMTLLKRFMWHGRSTSKDGLFRGREFFYLQLEISKI